MTDSSSKADAPVALGAERAGSALAASCPAVTSRWVLLASAAGAAGASALSTPFGVLPAPPKINSPVTALTDYAASHHHVARATMTSQSTRPSVEPGGNRRVP